MLRPVLSADLAHVNLSSLLHLCEAEFFSGRLLVASFGQIDLSSGSAVGARTSQGLVDVQAIRELFLERDGTARIELDAAVRGEPLAPMIALVMEGCRVLDEWEEVAEGAWRHSRQDDAQGPELAPALSALASVLPHLAQASSLDAALGAAKLPRSVALPHLRALIAAGVLTRDASLGVAAAFDPDDLLDQGRISFRDGDLATAETLWSRALATRPNDRVLAQNLRLVRQRLAR